MAKRCVTRSPKLAKRLVIGRLDESGQTVYVEAHGPAILPSAPRSRKSRRSVKFTPEQAQQMRQQLADVSRWITKEKALKWFEEQCATWVEAPYTTCTPSSGYAQELLAKARASGVRYTNSRGDGVFPKDGLPDPGPQFDLFFNLDDLVGWRDRHMSPPAKAGTGTKPAGGRKFRRAKEAIDALFGGDVPDQAVLSNNALCTKVNEWLKTDCEKHGIEYDPADMNDITILRAAGRAK